MCDPGYRSVVRKGENRRERRAYGGISKSYARGNSIVFFFLKGYFCFSNFALQVERHPHVLHLPAPHIWQIAPGSSNLSSSSNQSSNLVVTLELHVRAELGDEDVLELTLGFEETLGDSRTKMSPSPGERKLEGKGKWVDERQMKVGQKLRWVLFEVS